MTHYDYEVGKIRFVMENTSIDEFILLHDSCEIKDTSKLHEVFETPGSVAFSLQPAPFGMYLGKYERKVLQTMPIPIAKTKLDSVNFEETFNFEYARRSAPYTVIQNPLVNQQVFVKKFGRTNMKLENDWLIKYKATWSRSQLSLG